MYSVKNNQRIVWKGNVLMRVSCTVGVNSSKHCCKELGLKEAPHMRPLNLLAFHAEVYVGQGAVGCTWDSVVAPLVCSCFIKQILLR